MLVADRPQEATGRPTQLRSRLKPKPSNGLVARETVVVDGKHTDGVDLITKNGHAKPHIPPVPCPLFGLQGPTRRATRIGRRLDRKDNPLHGPVRIRGRRGNRERDPRHRILYLIGRHLGRVHAVRRQLQRRDGRRLPRLGSRHLVAAEKETPPSEHGQHEHNWSASEKRHDEK